MSLNMRSEIFPELDDLYTSKNPLVRNLFWGRIQTAVAFAQIKDDSVLLDVGCGSGHLLKSVRKLNSKCQCWATDVRGSKIMESVDCKFQIADARSLPFEEDYFDAVFILDILEHIKDNVDVAIKEIHRVLKPGRFAILSGPTESDFYRFCRSLLFHLTRKNKDTIRQEIDYHFHTIYELEQKFIEYGFNIAKRKRLPSYPLPSLFRISSFQKR